MLWTFKRCGAKGLYRQLSRVLSAIDTLRSFKRCGAKGVYRQIYCRWITRESAALYRLLPQTIEAHKKRTVKSDKHIKRNIIFVLLQKNYRFCCKILCLIYMTHIKGAIQSYWSNQRDLHIQVFALYLICKRRNTTKFYFDKNKFLSVQILFKNIRVVEDIFSL